MVLQEVFSPGCSTATEDEVSRRRSKSIVYGSRGIGAIVEAIEDRGHPEGPIIGISQGWKMTGR
jgi:hypothetical protein